MSVPENAVFDPDAHLEQQSTDQPPAFDPDAHLGQAKPTTTLLKPDPFAGYHNALEDQPDFEAMQGAGTGVLLKSPEFWKGAARGAIRTFLGATAGNQKAADAETQDLASRWGLLGDPRNPEGLAGSTAGGFFAPLPGGPESGPRTPVAPIDALIQKANAGSGKSVGAALDAIREDVGPNVASTNPVEHGDTLIDAYKAKDAAAQADISAKYKALKDANEGNFPVDGQTFVKNADSALKTNMKRPFLPSGIQSMLDEFRDGSTPMTFENFENMRTTLATEGRKAARSGDGNAEAAVNLVREQLESLPMTGANEQVKALADTARAAARARFNALEADPAYKAAVTDSVPPDRFVHKFITGPSATRDGVAQMRSSLEDNTLATQTMGVASVDHLRSVSGVDQVAGAFKQDAFNKHLGALAPRLDYLLDPTTLGRLETLGQVPGAGVIRRGAAAVIPHVATAVGAKALGPLGAVGGRAVGERVAEKILPP